jgi:hypothetical protein
MSWMRLATFALSLAFIVVAALVPSVSAEVLPAGTFLFGFAMRWPEDKKPSGGNGSALAIALSFATFAAVNAAHAQEPTTWHEPSSFEASLSSAMPMSVHGQRPDSASSLAPFELRREPFFSITQAEKAEASRFTVHSSLDGSRFTSRSINSELSGNTLTQTLTACMQGSRIRGASESRSQTEPSGQAQTPVGLETRSPIASMDAAARRLASMLRRLMRLSSSRALSAERTACRWMSPETQKASSFALSYQPIVSPRSSGFAAITTRA